MTGNTYNNEVNSYETFLSYINSNPIDEDILEKGIKFGIEKGRDIIDDLKLVRFEDEYDYVIGKWFSMKNKTGDLESFIILNQIDEFNIRSISLETGETKYVSIFDMLPGKYTIQDTDKMINNLTRSIDVSDNLQYKKLASVALENLQDIRCNLMRRKHIRRYK